MKNKKRTEFDTLGSKKIDSNRFWGAQTQRSLENFRIGNEKMPSRDNTSHWPTKKSSCSSKYAI